MNPIMSVVRGTAKAVDRTLSTTRNKMVEGAMPSPSMAYNLGMGIGPLLQSIVAEMDRKTDKKEEKQAKIADKAKIENKAQSKMLASQMNTMITVLRDIKNIGLLQLRSDQQKQFEARHQEYLTKEYNEEHPDKGSTFASLMKEKITPSNDTLTKMALGLGAAGGIWAFLLNDETKEMINQSLFGEDGLTKTLMKAWGSAFEQAPLLTILGTGIAAHLTGVLEMLGVAAFIAWKGGKLVYNIGKYVGTGMALTTAAPAATAIEGAAAAGAAATAANAARAATTTPAATMSPQVAAVAAQSKALLEQIEMTQRGSGTTSPIQTISTAAVTATEEVATTGSKIMGSLRLVASGLSHVMGVLGIVGSGYAAYEEGKEGKTWTAGLYGSSAALGTAAIASAFGPGTQVATPFLAAGSAVTGALGFITSMFEDSDAKRAQKEELKRRVREMREQGSSSLGGSGPSVSGLQSPQPAATGGAVVNVPASEVMGLISDRFKSAGYNDNQVWAAMANAARESGFNPNAHNTNGEDSVGLFQMNRNGGLGRGHSLERLKDPSYNTQLLLNALQAAEGQQGYFGDAARGFRQAKSKEEAAEYLRRFLFGNGTAAQQLAGANRQQQVNADFEAGRYGQHPSMPNASMFAGGATGLQPGASPSVISPSTITSADASSASGVAQITSAVNEFMKVANGGGINWTDGSSKVSINNNNSSGGGGGAPARVMDSIRSSVTGIVYPAEPGYS